MDNKLKNIIASLLKKFLEVARVKKGHLGGSFSVLDILIALFTSESFKLRKIISNQKPMTK